MDVERCGGWCCDYLQVDGGKRLCGGVNHELPKPILVNTTLDGGVSRGQRNVSITFHSDGSVVGTGFTLRIVRMTNHGENNNIDDKDRKKEPNRPITMDYKDKK